MNCFNFTGVDINVTAKEFLTYYYQTLSNTGWNGLLSDYSSSAMCTVNGVQMTPFNMVNDFASKNITKCDIHNEFATWKQKNDELTVTVSYRGLLYGFNNTPMGSNIITDIFTISISQQKIIDHIIHINNNLH
jgi:hypothetical protein